MISVIIPTYNREPTIEKSVKSVLDQSFTDLELIIIDDGSTDNTQSVIAALNDNRLRYYYQKNAGACAARNKGIALAEGDYIAFHDSDDIWHKNKLEKQMAAIKETDADILFCQLNRCNTANGNAIIPELEKTGFVKPSDLMVGISTQTLFMKRIVAEDVKFDEKMPRFQDLEWLLRAVKKYSLYGIKEVLVDYYFSDDSITMSSDKLLRGILRICQKHPDLEKGSPNVYGGLRSILLEEGISKMLHNDREYARFLKYGFSMSNKFRDKIKYRVVCFGLYKQAYMLKHCIKKLTKIR